MFKITKLFYQLFKMKLVLFFVLAFIFLVFSSFLSVKAENDYLTDYSSKRLVPIYNVQRNDNKIALTIDGAWGSLKTKKLLKLFAEEEIELSFFFTGKWLEENKDLAAEIIKAGHQIYNHSYSHPHFNNLSPDQIRAEILKTEALIDQYYEEKRKIKFFRLPYGEYNNKVIKIARELGYQVIQWNLDSHDWMNPGQEYIITRIKENISSGDIILFHNNSKNIVEVLTEIIPLLKKDFEFVKLEDLIYNNNYKINSFNGLQIRKKGGLNGN